MVGRKTQNGYKQMHFMAVKKSRKRSGFVIYSYFEDSAFTAVKREAKLQPRYVKGVICISSANVANRTYRKGLSFLSKMVYKRVTGGGGASPYKTLLSTPPGHPAVLRNLRSF